MLGSIFLCRITDHPGHRNFLLFRNDLKRCINLRWKSDGGSCCGFAIGLSARWVPLLAQASLYAKLVKIFGRIFASSKRKLTGRLMPAVQSATRALIICPEIRLQGACDGKPLRNNQPLAPRPIRRIPERPEPRTNSREARSPHAAPPPEPPGTGLSRRGGRSGILSIRGPMDGRSPSV